MAMAAVTSLGIHRPSALPYLIAEGILASETAEDSFRWQSTNSMGRDDAAVEEELLVTDYCVVWSRGGVIQRVFRFDSEREKITQAVFAKFPSRLISISGGKVGLGQEGEDESPGASTVRLKEITPKDEPPPGHGFDSASSAQVHFADSHSDKDRALVVILNTQAHVFFLHGTGHILHLPLKWKQSFRCPKVSCYRGKHLYGKSRGYRLHE